MAKSAIQKAEVKGSAWCIRDHHLPLSKYPHRRHTMVIVLMHAKKEPFKAAATESIKDLAYMRELSGT